MVSFDCLFSNLQWSNFGNQSVHNFHILPFPKTHPNHASQLSENSLCRGSKNVVIDYHHRELK
jgi:hypothetical protein